MSMPDEPTLLDIYRICVEQDRRDYTDLRDRAAYLDLVGAFPTHLRIPFTRALKHISYFAHSTEDKAPGGPLKIKGDVRSLLALDDHPMVRKVNELKTSGYELRPERSPNARRGYSRVRAVRGEEELIVQVDGSILNGTIC